MFEVQQQRLQELGEEPLVDIGSDGVRLPMRRTVERMIAEELRDVAAE